MHGLVEAKGKTIDPVMGEGSLAPRGGTQKDPIDYWEDRLARHGGLRGVGHISHSTEFNQRLYELKRRVFSRALAATSLDLAHARVLDVGSGSGFVVEEWIRLGANTVVASDFTSVATGNLRTKLPDLEVVQLDIGASGDLASLGRFDAVSAFEVLFHITDDGRYRQALRNIASLLRPGGFFFYTDNFVHSRVLRTTYQVNRTLSEITGSIESVGLRIERRSPLAIFMAPPVDMASPVWLRMWQKTIGRAARGRRAGRVIGTFLLPVDSLLTRLPFDGPSVELMICRRVT